MPHFTLAADIGGTKIAVARVSNSGKITHSLEALTPPAGGRLVVGRLIDLLRQLPQEDVQAIAVDVPGLAYRDGCVWAPNIQGWKRFPLREAMRREFKLHVVVESDRNAFVIGEAWQGAARNYRDIVSITLGTGVGVGILADGRLIRGCRELAGSVGWMAVRDHFLPKYKSVGCLEAHIAGPAISAAGRRLLGRNITAEELTQLAVRGHKTARKLLSETGFYLGLALANLVSTLNPEIIVIGGGVAAAGELLIHPARETMKRWGQPLAVKQVRLVPSHLGTRAALLGMAKMALDDLESP
jgi:glucokinase